jgi:hypothetical protein
VVFQEARIGKKGPQTEGGLGSHHSPLVIAATTDTYALKMGLGRYDQDLHRFRGFVSPSAVDASGNDGRITWY